MPRNQPIGLLGLPAPQPRVAARPAAVRPATVGGGSGSGGRPRSDPAGYPREGRIPARRPAQAPAGLPADVTPPTDEDVARKTAAEEEATGGGSAGAEDFSGIPKEDFIFLEERFGQPWLNTLTAAQVSAEAEWHRREELGFPTDRPSAALYAEHYHTAHEGVAVPQMPAPGVRSGQLDPSSVIALGLIPLGQAAPAGDEHLIEPALVIEGMVLTARDGSLHRVVYRDGRFLVSADGTTGSDPKSTGAPGGTQQPSPTQPPAMQPAPTGDVVKAARDGRVQGAVWGVLGGVVLGAVGAVVVLKLVAMSREKDADGRALPESRPTRSNPGGRVPSFDEYMSISPKEASRRNYGGSKGTFIWMSYEPSTDFVPPARNGDMGDPYPGRSVPKHKLQVWQADFYEHFYPQAADAEKAKARSFANANRPKV